MDQDLVSLKKYIFSFGLIYFALNLLGMGALYFFEIDNGNFMNIPMLIISALFTSNLFIKDNNRLPEKQEVRKLSLLSMLCTFISSASVYVLMFYFDPNLSAEDFNNLIIQIPIFAWVVILLMVGAAYYLALVINYGWLTKKAFARRLSE